MNGGSGSTSEATLSEDGSIAIWSTLLITSRVKFNRHVATASSLPLVPLSVTGLIRPIQMSELRSVLSLKSWLLENGGGFHPNTLFRQGA